MNERRITLTEFSNLFYECPAIEVYDDRDDFHKRENLLCTLKSDYQAEYYLQPQFANAIVSCAVVIDQARMKCLIDMAELDPVADSGKN